MSPITQQADFSIGFAENRDFDSSEKTVHYTEWLNNSVEFPDLASTTSNTDLSGGNWELLQKKEIDHEDHKLVSLEEEEETWARISSFEEDKHSYVEMAEKNAAELKPSKRTVQPLWPEYYRGVQLKKNTSDDTNYYDELYDDNLDIDLFNVHKSQGKHANRTRHLRKMHTLRTTDNYVQGILGLATSHGNNTNPLCYQEVKITNKSQALIFAAKFNLKKYGIHKETGGIKDHKTDFGEFSVNDMITRR